ncbi:MAG: tRNA guanosine(15) transglycosylase TgtA [Candidatus Lokiarchaeota archaeon]|nr:tRNA guanosine(15) transglycosylase TgtA [Candidatus Lokiarchaeota archaeon]
MEYELIDSEALGRIGKLNYKDYEVITPNLIPVVHPYDNIVKPALIKEIGFNCIFTNSYIIYQDEGKREKVLDRGLNDYLGFKGLIATDSGAFQQYMYNDKDIHITAEEIEKFQEDIGSDFPVILDIPVQPGDSFNQAQRKMETSLDRAKSNFQRRTKECCWIGPIHGAKYPELLEISSKEMSKLDFGIYAIGGLVKFFLDYRFDEVLKILLTVKRHIISNKPLHMFGLGLPQFFSLAVACGCDLMDSAAYILYAKENRYFTTSTGTKLLDDLKEFPCNCPICSKYTPDEVRRCDYSEKTRLLAMHNLYLSYTELKNIRQAIYDGNLWELIEQRVRSHPKLYECLSVIDKNLALFEKYEKIYKTHGRLFASIESIQRPIFMRYKKRIKSCYRIPKDVKYLIFLPELDIKGNNSPSIIKWLKDINNSTIQREKLHILFFSKFFGVIPIELIETYPMGQHEAISLSLIDKEEYIDEYIHIFIAIINTHKTSKKIAFLNPDTFINQFGEEEKFKDPLYERIFEALSSKYKIPVEEFRRINNIIDFFEKE